jgi:hypothetical protein
MKNNKIQISLMVVSLLMVSAVISAQTLTRGPSKLIWKPQTKR